MRLIKQMIASVTGQANAQGSAIRALQGSVGSELMAVPNARLIERPQLVAKQRSGQEFLFRAKPEDGSFMPEYPAGPRTLD